MTRQAAVTVENNFTKGLITEVTGVNSPENSVTETSNMIYDRRGRALRRPGIDYEPNHVAINLATSTTNDGVISEYLWETVSNVSSVAFVVVQVANKLLFFLSSGGAVSAEKKSFEVDLLTFKVAGWTDAQVYTNQVALSSGNGKLFIVHPYCAPFFISYDLDTDTITSTLIDVQARDFEGVEDTLDIATRPTTLTNLHKYNLWNQGWWQKVEIRALAVLAYSSILAIDGWKSNVGGARPDYPSNCDVWWYYKGTIPAISAANIPEFTDVFLTSQINKVAIGNTPAPKGHFLYSAWDTARSTQTDESGGTLGAAVPETSSAGARPSAVAFYYGRVFYGGVRKDKFASNIYFTQIVERDNQYGYCYQQNDPTSEKAFDLLPSDGGVIKIPDIVNILDMRVIGPSLYIFASNGIWAITGSNNSSFKATDYQVTKVTSYPALSKNTIVDVGGTPVWWNADAIYALGKNDVSQNDAVQNVTQTTIQTLYNNIPSDAKANAKGAFNQLDGIVYWIYRIAPVVNPSDVTKYDSAIVLDTVTKGFYTFSFPAASVVISGIVPVNNTLNQKIFKFLTTGNVGSLTKGFTFSELNNETMTDWETETGGVDWDSHFITGYRVRGELLKKFQTNYLTVITESNPASSCYIQGLWDYTNNDLSGRFTNPQQVYRTANFYAGYQRSKVKIRGQGYSLQFKFYSDGQKPFTIIGWAGFDTTNTVP